MGWFMEIYTARWHYGVSEYGVYYQTVMKHATVYVQTHLCGLGTFTGRLIWVINGGISHVHKGMRPQHGKVWCRGRKSDVQNSHVNGPLSKTTSFLDNTLPIERPEPDLYRLSLGGGAHCGFTRGTVIYNHFNRLHLHCLPIPEPLTSNNPTKNQEAMAQDRKRPPKYEPGNKGLNLMLIDVKMWNHMLYNQNTYIDTWVCG